MLKIKNPELTAVAAWAQQYPEERQCDIVLAGRSNVGKSSLINRLINRKNLARTSSTPGKTRTINFYGIDDLFYFVDLPGYGYARVSKEEQKAFGKMMDTYFDSSRPKVVWQIIDLRHPPTALDLQMNSYLRSKKLPYSVVATKSDKLSKNQIVKNKSIIARDLGVSSKDIVAFSAETGMGKDELLKNIEILLKYN